VGSVADQTAIVGQAYTLNLAETFDDVDGSPFGITGYSLGQGQLLPAGLTLNADNGVISGTATGAVAQGSFTIVATDGGGATASQTFNLSVVSAPTIKNLSALDGVTNFDVRSDIVLVFTAPISLGSGQIKIFDDSGGAGWTVRNTNTNGSKQDVTDNDVVITLSNGAVTGFTVGGVDKSAEMAGSVTKFGEDTIIISPAGSDNASGTDWDFDWDFASNYHVRMDSGVVRSAEGVANVAIDDSTTLNFRTVEPLGNSTGAPSVKMTTAGEVAGSYIWHHGHVQDSTSAGLAMNFGTGSHALVLQSEGGGDNRKTSIDGKVLLSGMGQDDLIYMDNLGDVTLATTDGLRGANWTGSGNSTMRTLDNVGGGVQTQTVFADYGSTGWSSVSALAGDTSGFEAAARMNANVIVFG
jgi:hypothetical protein